MAAAATWKVSETMVNVLLQLLSTMILEGWKYIGAFTDMREKCICMHI